MTASPGESIDAPPVEPGPARPRLDSVDLLRGLVMAVMVLDHVRDFVGDMSIDATDVERTSVPLFLTRWVTHFCAPTFVFLAGVGAYLAGRSKSKGDLSRFLLTRGLWLVFLELTFVRVGMAWSFSVGRGFVQVIWAIGWSMVALAALVHLPTRLVGAFGVAMCLAHNAFDGLEPERFGALSGLWKVLHAGGVAEPFPEAKYFVAYPLVPWIGVMAAGYAFGPILGRPTRERRRAMIGLGVALTLAFVALRWANVYGDPNPWSVQTRGPAFTALSFLNCEKYPPSLCYLLMTLGPAIAVLGLVDGGVGPIGRPLVTLGRVPLFFYLLQWPVAHGVALALAMIRGEPYGWLLGGGWQSRPDGYGYSLPVVYALWLVALAILYVPSRWFAELKRRRRDVWLSYF